MLRSYFDQGGLMMWPLAVCSVLLLAVVGERVMSLLISMILAKARRRRITKAWAAHNPSVSKRATRFGGWRRRGRRVSVSRSSTGPAWHYVPQVHRHVLRFFWDIPPQLGLLGTVLGLVQIFQGELGAEAFGRGVGTACFTTVFGLCVAVVARVACYLLDGLGSLRATPLLEAQP